MTLNQEMAASGTVAGRFLDAHTRARAAHCAPPLAWSEMLAAYAQQWADHVATSGCTASHSGGEHGENVATTVLGAARPEQVVGMWYDEVGSYDFQHGKPSQAANFAQLVWRASTQLGCGHAVCGNTEIWVCEYDPPGNVNNAYVANVAPTSCQDGRRTAVAPPDGPAMFDAGVRAIRGVVLAPTALGLPGVPLVFGKLQMSVEDHLAALASSNDPAFKQVQAQLAATLLYQRAKSQQGDVQRQTWTTARDILRKSAKTVDGPDNADVIHMLASYESLLGDDEAAAQAWSRLVAIAPDDKDAPYNRAWWTWALLRQHEARAAVAALGNEPVTQAQPELAYIGAWTRFANGDLPGAWPAIVAALQGWGTRALRDQLRDDALRFAARTGTAMATAFADLEPLLANGDQAADVALYVALAKAYQLAGRWADAVAALDAAFAGGQLAVANAPALRFEQADLAIRLDAPDAVARYAKLALAATTACGTACGASDREQLAKQTLGLAELLGAVFVSDNDARYYDPAVAIFDAVIPMLALDAARHDGADNERAKLVREHQRRRPGAGAYDKATISALLARHDQEIQACYEQAIADAPTLTGALVLQLDADPQGVIVSAIVQPDTGATALAAVASCVSARARSWKLPSPGARGHTSMTLRYTLAPRSATM